MQDELHERVAESFPGAQITIELDGNKAQITVISDAFADMSRVKKQQAVYASINDYIADGRLHAVTIHALTPDG